MDMVKHKRIILNFSHRCALNCEWCYVSFGRPAVDAHLVGALIQRVADLGFTSITFGGGDPFQIKSISSLLRKAKSLGLFVHVDTHGKGLKTTEDNFELLRDTIDLLGLPLDGPTSKIHDLMRSSQGHFSIVENRLSWAKQFKNKLKINTLVSSVNIGAMVDLHPIVQAFAPTRWSLYQYWPIGPGALKKEKHALSTEAFLLAGKRATEYFSNSGTTVEVNPQEVRRATYPIVDHEGSVFLHSSAPDNSYRFLGNLFSENTIAQIALECGEDRTLAVSRYMKLDIRQ